MTVFRARTARGLAFYGQKVPVPFIHGRFGYGVPKAKRNSIVLDEVEDNIADYFPAAASSSVLEEDAASHPQPAAALPSALSADYSPVGDEDSAVEPASSVEHEIVLWEAGPGCACCEDYD